MSSPLSEQVAYALPNVLYRLSPEIRNMIYQQVFDGDISNMSSLSLMRTSKELHLEAGSHFYANENINVQLPAPMPHPSTHVAGATVLPPINDRYLRFLKHLGIELQAGCASLARVQETATTIRKLTTIGAQFEEINLLIQWPPELSFWLTARLDDPIMDENHPITTALRHLLDSGVSKVVRVIAHGAFFGPGVATGLKAHFGSRLEFSSPVAIGQLVELPDPSVCEKPLSGCCSCSPCNIFGTEAGDATDDMSYAFGIHANVSDNILELESEGVSGENSLLIFDEDADIQGEEELGEDDDVDMEVDLIPLDEGEVDAIADNWDESSRLTHDASLIKVEMEFFVAMAPQLLTMSSRRS